MTWQNMVHCDPKLGNIVLNKKSRKITIANFCVGKHLLNEKDLWKDERGSPAYISPDVLNVMNVLCRIHLLHNKYLICNQVSYVHFVVSHVNGSQCCTNVFFKFL
ncbi:hypothetical protein NPIL_635162 [Nephila pilipes]|uniref:Protein kinase domain-containing protein n=1 Tax=Nephila pilipes TaxID=299642 RepID=A0A8X6Q3F8_NEPPI|nr:hypothetical protein NPIL_635162 [Nephila pilipes]